MKTIFKIGFNAVLLAMFLGMLLLPTGFMGIMKFEENSSVLSAQDSNSEGSNSEESTIKSINDSEVPLDVEEMILKMEREYYQKQQSEFVEDTEGTEDKEDKEDEKKTDNENIEMKEEDTEEDIQIQETN